MVIVTIDSDFLNGKYCFEKQIRNITINNEGSIVDTTDMKGQPVKKLEFEVSIPDGTKRKWRPNQTSKKSLVKLFGPDTNAWAGKKLKIMMVPYEDTYSIQIDELDTAELNKVKKGGGNTLL